MFLDKQVLRSHDAARGPIEAHRAASRRRDKSTLRRAISSTARDRFRRVHFGDRAQRRRQCRPFIPAQTKPVKVFNDGLTKFSRAPVGIQILDSENELSAALSGAFLSAPEGDGMPQMKITCRRWGDSAPIFCHPERNRGISHFRRICMNRARARARLRIRKLNRG